MRPYRLEIYDRFFNNSVVLSPQDFEIKNFASTLNKPGSALFAIKMNSKFALKEILVKKRKIKILRWSKIYDKYIPKWAGYIEDVQQLEDRFEVGCLGNLQLFDNRVTNQNQTFIGVGGEQAFNLLDQKNGEDNTGILKGETDYTKNVNIQADLKPVLEIWEDIAKNEEGEFEIDVSTNKLNFYKLVGADKSSFLKLIYDWQKPNTNNIEFTRPKETGSQIFNYIIGIGKDFDDLPIVSIKFDQPSIDNFGRQEKVEAFDNARTQGQLDDLTQSFLNQHKGEIANPEIRLKPKQIIKDINGNAKEVGIDLDEINLGDIVAIYSNTIYNLIDEKRRVVEIAVSLSSSGSEDIQLKLNTLDQKLEIISDQIETAIGKDALKKQRSLLLRLYR